MKIGLVPVAAKPYHAGHHALVEMAAGENDEVLLYVSLSDRKRKGEFPIWGADMKRVWEEEIEKVLPGNVTPVYGGNPVRSVFEVLQSAEEKIVEGTPMEHTYTVYSDPVDTSQNYTQAARQKYFPTLAEQGLVLFAAEENQAAFTRGVGTPDMSGTTMRKALQTCDVELFKKGLPAGVNAENVYKILCKENVLRSYIKAIIVG